ncbi:unnamed protein product [Mytilus coruscus]|uniref:Mab-21-like HhH/H2TH-like domain-containing protein n=1 Tax=Mytilus coruscus TaxID=42192 RepID=A0A6J8ARA0_MYTCO|nr:unnamed protein product [Mytilus coruscus]
MLKMPKISKEKGESLNFYKYICQRIGSEEVVRVRRLTFVISDIGQNETIITSGSKGEGLNFNSSDLDIMFIDPCAKVYESETEVVKKGGRLPFIMNADETQPCFTQLYLVTRHQNQTLVKVSDGVLNMLEINHLGYVLSSEQYKQFHLSRRFCGKWSAKIHGPCIADEYDNTDFAWCLKCDKWIPLARPWKYTDEKIYLRFLKDKNVTLNYIQHHVVKLMNKEKLHTLLKSLTLHMLTFHSNSSLVPQEIQQDVSSTPNMYDPLPFALFLYFLCNYHLHDLTSCRKFLQRLKHAQWTLLNCGTNVFHPQSVNTVILYGIAHQLMGNTNDARHAF